MTKHDIIWFEELRRGDVGQVGGKNASLGEMIGAMKGSGIAVPDGFATTAAAYRGFLAAAGIEAAIRKRLATLRAGTVPLALAA
ncbi:MAG: PEP/pyruvate-binding domain-containing protein, partial [Sphingomonas parapaucimobilis]